MSQNKTTPRAHGYPLSRVIFRRSPEDFIVDETLIFDPDGDGEHVYLHIKKRNTNTQWLAGELAKYANIKQRDVSYAGLKDRHAITSQWFSLLLHKGKEPDWDLFRLEGIDILQVTRHRTKLRPGMAKKNRFIITLYDVCCEEEALKQRIQRINQQGVPNYYGEQRFGHHYNNLEQARQMFEGTLKVKHRNRKSLYLSAARSDLFNQVLAERVSQHNWNIPLPGDCMMLDGSNSFFAIEQVENEIIKRAEAFDIHPTGPLWGQGEPLTKLQTLQLENEVLSDQRLFQQGLENASMKMDRRALRLLPVELEYSMLASNTIKLTFELSSGQYATTLLHELFEWNGR